MKVIIAGPRTLSIGHAIVSEAVEASGFYLTAVVSGGATGVDRSGEIYAKKKAITCIIVPADWLAYGPAAGPIRNTTMAAMADALLVIKKKGMDTKGTDNMVKKAEIKGIPIYIHEVGG